MPMHDVETTFETVFLILDMHLQLEFHEHGVFNGILLILARALARFLGARDLLWFNARQQHETGGVADV